MNRTDFIGSTDAGTIAGLDPYKSRLQLYYEKRGEIEPDPAGDAAYFGNLLEDIVASVYAERSGCKVRRVNKRRYHKENPWMAAQIDRDIVGTKKQLECKTASFMLRDTWGKPGTDEVPERYLLQTQHALAVTGNEVCDLAVLIGGQDYRVYTIPRDDGLIGSLIMLEHDFWERVRTGNRPDLDEKRPELDRKVLERVYPGTDGTTIALPEEELHWHIAVQQLTEERLIRNKILDYARNRIAQAAGNAAVITVPQGEYRRRLIKRKAYETEATEYMELKFYKPKKEASK